MAGKDQIVRTLQLLEAAKKIPKPDRTLYEAWKIALKNQSDETTEKALCYLLENGKGDNYHVQPDEFVSICWKVIKIEKKERNAQQVENVYYPPTDSQVTNINNVLAQMKTTRAGKRRYFDVVEHCDTSGEVIYYSCRDHVSAEKFVESCVYDYGRRPREIKHVYFQDRQIPIKDRSGNTERFKNSFEKAASGDPVTIGYL